MANLRLVGAQVDTVYATNCHDVWQNIEALKYQVLPGALSSKLVYKPERWLYHPSHRGDLTLYQVSPGFS